MAIINGQQVETLVNNADGTAGGDDLTSQELAVVTAADTALRGDADFQRAYPGARLSRVESNRGVDDRRNGRFSLRYEVPNQVPQEFWAHQAKENQVNLKTGMVAVVLPAT